MSRHPIGCDPAEFARVPISDLLRRQAVERRSRSLPMRPPTPPVPRMVPSTHPTTQDQLNPTSRDMPASPAKPQDPQNVKVHRTGLKSSKQKSLIDSDLANLDFLDEIFTEIRYTIPIRKTVTGRAVFEAACNRLSYYCIGHIEDVQEAKQKEREHLYILERQRRAREEEVKRQAVVAERRRRRTTAHSPVRVSRYQMDNDSARRDGHSRYVPASSVRRQPRTGHSPPSRSRHHRTTPPLRSPPRRRVSFTHEFRSPPSESRKYRSPSPIRQRHQKNRHRSSPLRKRYRSPSARGHREFSSTPPRKRRRSETPLQPRRRTPSPYSMEASQRSGWSSTEREPRVSSSPTRETSPLVSPSLRSRKARMSEPVRRATPPPPTSKSLAQLHKPLDNELDLDNNDGIHQSPVKLSDGSKEPALWDHRLRKPSAEVPNMNEELAFDRLEQAQKHDVSDTHVDQPSKDTAEVDGPSADVESEDSLKSRIRLPIVLPRPYIMRRCLVSDFTSLTPVIHDDDDGSSTEEERRVNSRRVRSRSAQASQYYDEDGRLTISSTVSRAFMHRLRIDSCYRLNPAGTAPLVYQIETPISSEISTADECIEIALRHNIVPFRREDMSAVWSSNLRKTSRRNSKPASQLSAAGPLLHTKEDENNAGAYDSFQAFSEKSPVMPSVHGQKQSSPKSAPSSELQTTAGNNRSTGCSKVMVGNDASCGTSKLKLPEKILPNSESVDAMRCSGNSKVVDTAGNVLLEAASLKTDKRAMSPAKRTMVHPNEHTNWRSASIDGRQQIESLNNMVSNEGVVAEKKRDKVISKSANSMDQVALMRNFEKIILPPSEGGGTDINSHLNPNGIDGIIPSCSHAHGSKVEKKDCIGGKTDEVDGNVILSSVDTEMLTLPCTTKPDENAKRGNSESSSREEGELKSSSTENRNSTTMEKGAMATLMNDPSMVQPNDCRNIIKTVLEEGELSYDDVIDATGGSLKPAIKNGYMLENMAKPSFEVNPEQSQGRQISGTMNVNPEGLGMEKRTHIIATKENKTGSPISPKKKARNASPNGFVRHSQNCFGAGNGHKSLAISSMPDQNPDIEMLNSHSAGIEALFVNNVGSGNVMEREILNPQQIQHEIIQNSAGIFFGTVPLESDNGDRLVTERPAKADRIPEVSAAKLHQSNEMEPGTFGSQPMGAMTSQRETISGQQTMPIQHNMATVPMPESKYILNSSTAPDAIYGALGDNQVCGTGRFSGAQHTQAMHQMQSTIENNLVLDTTESPVVDCPMSENMTLQYVPTFGSISSHAAAGLMMNENNDFGGGHR